MVEGSAGAVQEAEVGLTDAQLTDVVESWLKHDPNMRYAKARTQGGALHLEVTRRHFKDARQRLGLTAPAAPQPDRRRETTSHGKRNKVVAAPPIAVEIATAPARRGRRRRARLDGLASLVTDLEAVVQERDRARAAIEEILRIVKALH